jgi:hypothetical protein
MALAARADFVLVRPSELLSRAWKKDAADAHARDCPNIKRIINQFNRIRRWVASATVRVTDDAQMRLSMLKRFIELAHCCRDVHRTCLGMYAVHVDLNQWAVQRLKGLWEKLPTKWEKRNGRTRPALQSQVELGCDARAAALRVQSGRGRRLTMRACST